MKLLVGARRGEAMQSAAYYREHVARARRLRSCIVTPDIVDTLERLARDYDVIDTDLDRGAIETLHPERLPQRNHLG
jgi:hypothetical protein